MRKLKRHLFQSRRYQWVIFCSALYVSLFLIFEVIKVEGFGYDEQFPYFSYELGFRQPNYSAKIFKALVMKVDDVILPEPMGIEDFLRSHGGRWSPNTSYRVLVKLGESSSNETMKNSARQVLREHHFKNLRLKSIEYEVRTFIIDPLDYWRNGNVLSQEGVVAIREDF